MALNKYLLIIALNANGLNAPIKRHRVAEWIRKHDPHICCLQETHLKTKDLHRLKVKKWKKYSKHMDMENKTKQQNKTKNRVAVLVSDKIDLKSKARYREEHFMILKGRIHQENITIVNIYAPNVGSHKHIRMIWEGCKKDIESNTHIVEDFNTPLSTADRCSKKRINKDIVALNNTLSQIQFIDIYRIFHPKLS